MNDGFRSPASSRKVGAKSILQIMSLHIVPFEISRGYQIMNGIWNDSSYMNRFIEPDMITEKKSLIRGINDNCVLGQLWIVEIFEHSSNIIINRYNSAQISFDLSLIF